jgi:3-hydroxyacyl-[acyl-carrier-protein] dehydratase
MIQPVFKILSTEKSADKIVALLAINHESDIFKGHFPEQPVVPGACMLQTVKEILEDVLSAPVKLTKADNIKFLNITTPDVSNLMI